jgi:type IV secretion system protein VirB5
MTSNKKTIFKPLEIKNPFKGDDDRQYAELLYDKIKESQTWRKTFLLSCGMFFITIILFFVSIAQQKTVPVLINVMPSGESQYLGEVRQNAGVQVPEAAMHYQIRRFISNMRSVPTDYQVLYDNIDECFAMVTSGYSPILRDSLLNDSPFDLVGKKRRAVEFESVLLITGRSYAANWTETVIEPQTQKSVKMRAVVTLRLIPPTDVTIKRNPLGIYIENFEMTEL